ncbi:MAG: regulatory protein RecX [Sphaerochaeta sp.]|nr:recombination regulator RecX [Sphaerochaeta sp.]MDX9914580.1 regulatory protein RecX [Sphaerochaeta sp.]
MSRELFVRLALHLGQELTEAEYHELRELQRQHECKVQGLRYLAMREHTRFELVQKLLKKRFEQRTIVVVLDQLIAENLLSEYRYARLFIEGRLRRKVEGRAMMARRLSAKQVNHGDAQRALDELYTEEMTALYVRRAYQGTIAKVGEQNIRYALQKIGFSAYEIRLALEEWGGEDA